MKRFDECLFDEAFVKGQDNIIETKCFYGLSDVDGEPENCYYDEIVGKNYDLEKGLRQVWDDRRQDCYDTIEEVKTAMQCVLKKHGLDSCEIKRLFTVFEKISVLLYKINQSCSGRSYRLPDDEKAIKNFEDAMSSHAFNMYLRRFYEFKRCADNLVNEANSLLISEKMDNLLAVKDYEE